MLLSCLKEQNLALVSSCEGTNLATLKKVQRIAFLALQAHEFAFLPNLHGCVLPQLRAYICGQYDLNKQDTYHGLKNNSKTKGRGEQG